MLLARPARAVLERVLEVRVAGADLVHALERRARQRRTAEVRVHDHPGRIHDAAEPRRAHRLDLGGKSSAEVAGLGAGADLGARAVEHDAGRVHGH